MCSFIELIRPYSYGDFFRKELKYELMGYSFCKE